jgi:C_GCAxxG_C_C family probable redox protein
MNKPSVGPGDVSGGKKRERAAELREKWLREFKPGKVYDAYNPKTAAEWRDKWLSGIKLGEGYDMEARYEAVRWLINWVAESLQYTLNGCNVAPFCTEMILEALQLHGGRPILPVEIDRLEDITIGLGAGLSSQGEVCGAVMAHTIAIGIDVTYRTRETAAIRRDVAAATRKFCRLFRERFGALRCEELTGLCFLKADGSEDPEAWKNFSTGSPPIGARCLDFMQFAIYAPLPSEEG